jgi:ABC-2 type transport system permease protein
VSLFNPVVCLINGLRWAFDGAADVHIAVSTGMAIAFLAACLTVVWWVDKPDGGSSAEPARLNRR